MDKKEEERKFYKVSRLPEDAPLRDHLLHGYEERHDFYQAVKRITDRWHDRVGEAVGERHGFLRLRFHDTPGGRPDEEWLPIYLLRPVPIPAYAIRREPTPQELLEDELDRALWNEW